MNAADTWNEWHLVLLSPWGWTGRALALAVALVTLVLAWRALRRDVRGKRYVLLGLRALGLLAALVLFFQPAVQLRNVTRVPNHIAILLDTSESMSLSEQVKDKTRAQRAAALLRREARVLDEWRKEHKIDFYTFGDRLVPATEEALVRPGGAPSHADATRIREALAAVRQRYEGRDLGGVVLLSDGLDNGRLVDQERPERPERPERQDRPDRPDRQGPGDRAEAEAGRKERGEVPGFDGDTRDFLRALDAPVHTVAIGRPGLHDVSIARVLADEFAFARTAVHVEARLVVAGAEAAGWTGRRLPVTLRRDGVPVLTVDVELNEGQSEYRVVFPFTPEWVGKYLYEISTPVLEGEAIAENNRRAFVLKVIRDKIRVVHVAGRPSWDVRFLRGLLKHDPNIDLVSFFILRSPSDIELGSSAETSLIAFPCEELFQQQLRSFDLIILHNFNFNAYCAQYLQPAIVPFVKEGGALAMIGGDLSFSSGGYYGSDVAQVLPVELYPEISPGLLLGGGGGKDHLVSPEPFRPRLTVEGRSHVLTALRLDVRDNEGRWEALPMLDGVNLVPRLRPSATVLLAHPFLKDADGKALPVVAVSEFGKGRSMALLTDSAWRWGFGAVGQSGAPGPGNDREPSKTDSRGTAYQRFFEQSIRWLIRDPSLRLLRVETLESEYGRDQPVRIEIKALGPDYRPAPRTEVVVSVQRIVAAMPAMGPRGVEGPGAAEGGAGGEAGPVLSRAVRTDEEGEGHLELEPLRPGGYRVTARATLGGRPTEDMEVFLVRGASRELENPEADDRLLRAISKATSGQARKPSAGLAGLTFHEPHIVRVNKHRDVELWDRSWVLLLAALCFGLNWTLRRRWGYA